MYLVPEMTEIYRIHNRKRIRKISTAQIFTIAQWRAMRP